jgi:FMN-dependent NADH-azoreductase
MTGVAPSAEEVAEVAAVHQTIDRFLAADKYLFSIPMWNFSMPYKLKQFFDTIVQPGRTFGFDPARGYFGLVPGDRKVQLVIASGGSYAEGTPMAPFDHLRPYLGAILGFIGLTNVETITADSTAYGPAVSEPILSAALANAMKAGAAF